MDYLFFLIKDCPQLLCPTLSSLVLTRVGAVTVACTSVRRRLGVHGGRVLVLGAARLDGAQVAVAARPEARGSRQIQSLHGLRLPLTVWQRVPAALPVYLKERVQTHTLRAEGRLRNVQSKASKSRSNNYTVKLTRCRT